MVRLKNVKNASFIMKCGKYFVSDPEKYKGKWHEFFGNNNPICIEIGMGKGKFIIENALRYPNINFIGIEKYDSVIFKGVMRSNEYDLKNLVLLRFDVRLINDIFINEIDTIYLNFSDPWPKDRHAKRRLTSNIFLQRYDTIFEGRKKIIMKTDNDDLFQFSLTSLVDYGYKIVYCNCNLDCLDGDNIMTEYEEKFYNKGKNINKLEAILVD